MPRQIKLEVTGGTAGQDVVLKDSQDGQWGLRIVREEGAIKITLTERLHWTILIEGYKVGAAVGEDPTEVMREVFRDAGLESLPEAVVVKVLSTYGQESWIIFTLGGNAYKVDPVEFARDVVLSSNWLLTRQAKRTEIDALVEDLKKLAQKRKP